MPLAKTRFLLADDDLDDAFLFCEALATVDTALKCDSVENGEQLFEFLSDHSNQPDIIFLDINMPIMNGWDCLRRLKTDEVLKSIPTIMYSTSAARKDIDTAYSLGALAFLSKPEDFNELSEILRTVATVPHDSLATQLRSFSSVK